MTREQLAKLSLDALRQKAGDRKIEGRSSMSRDQLIAALLKSDKRPPRIG